MSWLTIRIELEVPLAVVPDVEHLRAQRLRGQGVDLAEWLVHEQDLGVDGEGAGHAHPLLHPPRQLARIRVAEPLQADHADGAPRPLLDFALVEAQRAQDGGHVLLDRHPGEEREALEDDGDPRVEPVQGRP